MVVAAEARDAAGAADAAEGVCAEAAAAALAAAEAAVLASDDVTAAREAHVARLREVLRAGTAEGLVVAVGECGLDYDRLQFCTAGVQRAGFEAQLRLSS
eukprot:4003268-Prymnesium_polylepis.1